MKIYSGTSNKKLSKLIFDQMVEKGYDLSEKSFESLQIDKFSDGEILPIFTESIRDQDVFFIQSTNNSDSIIETLLVMDAAKRAGCGTFNLVAPFQSYSRQDKTDHLRSSIGSKMLADILDKVGLDQIITIDLHSSSVSASYNCPMIHLNGNKIFIEYIKSLKLDNLCMCSPDFGALKKNVDFSKAFPDATFAVINKKRIRPNEIHSMELLGDVSGKNVIIVDDMADTMGTLKNASKLLADNGSLSIRAIATHGILSGQAMENLDNSALTELVVSDTIYSVYEKEKISKKLKVISCSGLISSSIHRLIKHQSINELNII